MPMLTCKQFKQLHQLIDQVYDEADARGYTWQELAEKAGLCYTTVRKLGRYDTMYPRTQTVMFLARAVGFRVEFVREAAKAAA